MSLLACTSARKKFWLVQSKRRCTHPYPLFFEMFGAKSFDFRESTNLYSIHVDCLLDRILKYQSLRTVDARYRTERMLLAFICALSIVMMIPAVSSGETKNRSGMKDTYTIHLAPSTVQHLPQPVHLNDTGGSPPATSSRPYLKHSHYDGRRCNGTYHFQRSTAVHVIIKAILDDSTSWI